jgi:hypothetical protein
MVAPAGFTPPANPEPTKNPAGERDANPFRAIAEALQEFRDVVEKSVQKPLKDAAAAGQPFGTAFGEIKKAIGGALPEGFQTAGKALTMLTGTLKSAGVAGVAAAASLGVFADLGKQIAGFVQLASPGTVQLFNRALEDSTALIGRAFTPILELLTEVIRAGADSLGGFVEVGGRVAQGLRPLVGALGVLSESFGRVGLVVGRAADALAPMWVALSESMAEVMGALQPLVDLMIDFGGEVLVELAKAFVTAVNEIVPYVTAAARAFGDLARWLADVGRAALALFGLDLPNESGTREGSSVGAAAKSASVGSLESTLQKATISAFSLGSASTSPELTTATATKEIAQKATEIYREIRGAVTAIENLPDRLGQVVAGAVNGVTSGVREAAAPAVDAVSGALAAADRFSRDNFGFGIR